METVNELIPHTGDMVLLDRVIEYNANSLTAELTVRNDHLFAENAIPAWVGIEYMAQAIAAYAGVQSRQAGQPVRLGFLLGTRRYQSSIAQFTAGTVLTIKVEKIMHDDSLGVFACQISGESVAVSAHINVYQPPQARILDQSFVKSTN